MCIRDSYQDVDIHVHVPEIGPVDGPSAGITMCTAITSALLRIPVRRTVAMTGEITLRGNVRPIGGLKEKTLAAHRGEIEKVIVPRDNAKDIPDIPVRIRTEIEIVPVEHMDQVLKEALLLDEPDLLFAGIDPIQAASRQLQAPELPTNS